MDRRKKVIEAAEKALVELEKVIKQEIDLAELDPEKAKIAAQAKWAAIEDSFKIRSTCLINMYFNSAFLYKFSSDDKLLSNDITYLKILTSGYGFFSDVIL